MAVFKCKECGGDVKPYPNGSTGKCLYCGAEQTLPKDKDEKISQLLNRANDFRRVNDFDRAMFLYENVLEIDETEPEAHWGLFLSKYGVEYVPDTFTKTYKPTLHKITSVSVFDDIDYQATLKYATPGTAWKYKEDATIIEAVMKELLRLSANQEPYDIFISYKKADDITGQRTEDSFIAHDLYNELTAQGYKVFFAPKSLVGDGLWEPKIYSAIISAKVMLVVSTKPQYLESFWVKNEWTRFAELVENGEEKVIAPVYKNMDADKLPNKLSQYQAYDISSLTFLEDIKKVIVQAVKKKSHVTFDKNASSEDAFLERGFLELEKGEFNKADSFFENVLNINPHNSQAYFGKLMIEMKVTKQSLILTSSKPLKEYVNFERAVRFADHHLKTTLLQYEEKVQYALDEPKYKKALSLIEGVHANIDNYQKAIEILRTIPNFKDTKDKISLCYQKIKEYKYNSALNLISNKYATQKSYAEAAEIFNSIGDFKDAKEKVVFCYEKINELKYNEALRIISSGNVSSKNYAEAERIFKSLKDYRDSREKAAYCLETYSEQEYKRALALISGSHSSRDNFIEASQIFGYINGYKDSKEKSEYCIEKIQSINNDEVLQRGIDKENSAPKDITARTYYEEAIEIYKTIPGWKDADKRIAKCEEKIGEIQRKVEKEEKKSRNQEKRNKVEDNIFTYMHIVWAIIVAIIAILLLIDMFMSLGFIKGILIAIIIIVLAVVAYFIGVFLISLIAKLITKIIYR